MRVAIEAVRYQIPIRSQPLRAIYYVLGCMAESPLVGEYAYERFEKEPSSFFFDVGTAHAREVQRAVVHLARNDERTGLASV